MYKTLHDVSGPKKPGSGRILLEGFKGRKSAGSWGIKIVITINPIRFDKAILPEGIHVDLFQLNTKILIDTIFKIIIIVKSYFVFFFEW